MQGSERVQSEFQIAADLATSLAADQAAIERVGRVATVIGQRIQAGGKILAVGNGGSCADAVHFCEELTGRYREDRAPIGALACADGGHLTCVGNDYGFEEVFARWVRGLGRERDSLIALSTSGNSANIVRSVEAAREHGMFVVLLLGKGGGALKDLGDESWIVPGETADRIQELHMLILHSLVGAIERAVAHG